MQRFSTEENEFEKAAILSRLQCVMNIGIHEPDANPQSNGNMKFINITKQTTTKPRA